jgi:hypothetical protein
MNEIKIALIGGHREYQEYINNIYNLFYMYRQDLIDKNISFEYYQIDESVLENVEYFVEKINSNYNVCFLYFSFGQKESVWNKHKDIMIKMLKSICIKKIFIDNIDNTKINFNNHEPIFDNVDIYLKSHCLKNLHCYKGWDWPVGLDFYNLFTTNAKFLENREKYIKKIKAGWHLGCVRERTISQLFEEIDVEKNIDVYFRGLINRGKVNETGFKVLNVDRHRTSCYDSIKNMSCNKIVSEDKIPGDDYISELRRAKISISPFGYGEHCYRDYESIICDALLIKPNVDYILSYPNLFIPYETYVPVDFDFKNLSATVNYYLENESERKRIVNNAKQKYKDFFNNKEFLNILCDLIY